MDQFILCPSCGFCIGNYVEFLTYSREALYKSVVFSDTSKIKDFDPEKLALNPGAVPPLEEIFDALEIKKRCCKMRLTSMMKFVKHY